MDVQTHVNAAIEAAQAAGRFLARQDASSRQVVSSAGRDLHLAADQQAEALILEVLRRKAPFSILTEESGEMGGVSGPEPVWIVDPLDGTVNYSRGVPLCCVSIALRQAEDLLAAVVYDFNRDELFTATQGGGAFLNQRPMHVSSAQEPSQAILATGFPLNFDLSGHSLARFAQRIQAFKKVRMLGSAALSLAYVACGRADAYIEESIMIWDVAAGLLLVTEAGGFASGQESQQKAYALNVVAGSNKDLCA